MQADHWKPTRAIVKAIFDSYHYNRDSYHMIDLCKEVSARIDNNAEVEWTDDGNVIYGILVLLYGDYGTSPRGGWLKDNIENIKIAIYDITEEYKDAFYNNRE